jgi:hypothetical protein
VTKTTLAGLEPTRDKPNRFLVDRLNRSATVLPDHLETHWQLESLA